MHYSEKLFESLTTKELHSTLDSIADNDWYVEDFSRTQMLKDFLFMLEIYDLVFVAADERILLTSSGRKTLLYLNDLLI